MRRMILLVCAAALGLAMTAVPAAAASTQAANYETVELSCDVLGDITIEVVSRGHWGAAKVQGTNTTLIQAWATETVTYLGPDEDFEGFTLTEQHAKGNDDIDDTCRVPSWSQTFGEDEVPPGLPAGEYQFDIVTGVKVRGR